MAHEGALHGMRIIDWTQFQAGPYAGFLLAYLGAEVIHLEHPETGDGLRVSKLIRGVPVNLPERNIAFEVLNRNKKSIAIDLRHSKGRQIIYELAAKSDALITNFKEPERYGMDYETLQQFNSKLIYGALSGFGKRGRQARDPSFETTGFAQSGLMFLAGEDGMPPVALPHGLGDRAAGIMLAFGTLAALLARERGQGGQQFFTSQLRSLLALAGYAIEIFLFTGKELKRWKRENALNPLWNWYQCRDGLWVALSMPQVGKYWPTFCKAIGMPELEKELDPTWWGTDFGEKANPLVSILDKVFSTRSYSEWEECFREAGELVFSKCNSLAEVVTDAQVLENEYIVEIDHELGRKKVLNYPIQFELSPMTMEGSAPEFAQHNEDVLINILGYTREQIAQLKNERVIV